MSTKSGYALLGIFLASFGGVLLMVAFDIGGFRTELNRGVDAPYHQGRDAGAAGLPPESCPYAPTWNQEEKRTLWMRGWQSGKLEGKAKE